MYSLSDFDYFLPTELIAQSPVNPRDAAKLLHISNGAIADYVMRDLPSLLRPNDLIIANDTKVIPAQLYGYIDDKLVGFTLHKKRSDNEWLAFAKPAKRCLVNSVVKFNTEFSGW